MSYRKQNMRNDDRNDDPPYSRLFIVCNKQIQIEDLRNKFEAYGVILDLHMPKDRVTGGSKGIAYVRYTKTSSAAAAIQGLHFTRIGDCPKPIRVMIASTKNDNQDTTDEKYRRLFIKVGKDVDSKDIKEHFSSFGYVESVYIQKDKETEESRGFAYVCFKTFLDAAKAFEGCDRKYKAIFATPKEELKRSRNNDNISDNFYSSSSSLGNDGYHHYSQSRDDLVKRETMTSLTRPQDGDTVWATCSPQVPQKYIERLFNILPGMVQFNYTSDTVNGMCKATVTYDTCSAAKCALQKLNNFEFPSGEIVTVKPINPLSTVAANLSNIVNSFKNVIDKSDPNLAQLADAIAQASTLIKEAASGKDAMGASPSVPCIKFCNVPLPNPQPLVSKDSKVAKRCFVVFKPEPLPAHYLKDAFCRFGDLIDVITYPNRTYGFVKYASVQAADEAIQTLHGAVLCGVKLKVLEADEKTHKNDKPDDDSTMDHNLDTKRMKIYDGDGNMSS